MELQFLKKTQGELRISVQQWDHQPRKDGTEIDFLLTTFYSYILYFICKNWLKKKPIDSYLNSWSTRNIERHLFNWGIN